MPANGTFTSQGSSMQADLVSKYALVHSKGAQLVLFITVISYVNLKLEYKNGECRRAMLYPCLLEVRHPGSE